MPSSTSTADLSKAIPLPPSVVQLRNVDFAYDDLQILRNIDLEIREGEFLGIVGPNAGGKSTLLKLILGLLEPQRGEIRVLGKRPGRISPAVGYVPQHPSFSRDFPISVEQVVELGLLGSGGGDGSRGASKRKTGLLQALLPQRISGDQREAIHQALCEVEACSLAKRQIGSLSGGQLQRVLLARALVSQPEILILDEPTANIDQRLESEIFDLLKKLNQRMTILVVSHDIAFISDYVSRVACINQTLVCHHTDAIDGDVIQDLYGEHVRMIAHSH